MLSHAASMANAVMAVNWQGAQCSRCSMLLQHVPPAFGHEYTMTLCAGAGADLESLSEAVWLVEQ